MEIVYKDVCYNELPVSYNNQPYFMVTMAPKTRTLQKYGTEIDCNHPLPSAIYLDGDWFSITSKVNEIKKPQTLKPSLGPWTYNNLELLMTAGIYEFRIEASIYHQRLSKLGVIQAEMEIYRFFGPKLYLERKPYTSR